MHTRTVFSVLRVWLNILNILCKENFFVIIFCFHSIHTRFSFSARHIPVVQYDRDPKAAEKWIPRTFSPEFVTQNCGPKSPFHNCGACTRLRSVTKLSIKPHKFGWLTKAKLELLLSTNPILDFSGQVKARIFTPASVPKISDFLVP